MQEINCVPVRASSLDDDPPRGYIISPKRENDGRRHYFNYRMGIGILVPGSLCPALCTVRVTLLKLILPPRFLFPRWTSVEEGRGGRIATLEEDVSRSRDKLLKSDDGFGEGMEVDGLWICNRVRHGITNFEHFASDINFPSAQYFRCESRLFFNPRPGQIPVLYRHGISRLVALIIFHRPAYYFVPVCPPF